jgi:hypothetical protein
MPNGIEQLEDGAPGAGPSANTAAAAQREEPARRQKVVKVCRESLFHEYVFVCVFVCVCICVCARARILVCVCVCVFWCLLVLAQQPLHCVRIHSVVILSHDDDMMRMVASCRM